MINTHLSLPEQLAVSPPPLHAEYVLIRFLSQRGPIEKDASRNFYPATPKNTTYLSKANITKLEARAGFFKLKIILCLIKRWRHFVLSTPLPFRPLTRKVWIRFLLGEGGKRELLDASPFTA